MAFIQHYKVPLILSLIKFLLPFLLQHPVYELHRDEYLYLAQGLHPAWGFMEVPPLLAVFAKATQLLGAGFFWVKFWPSLFGALTVWERTFVKQQYICFERQIEWALHFKLPVVIHSRKATRE